MSHAELKDVLAWLTALTGLIGAIVTVFKYFNYRSRKDRVDVVGARFSSVVDALGSKDEVKRRAAAIMLRRFFDPRTEFGVAGTPYLLRRFFNPRTKSGVDGTPYANEAVNVIAAILREERSSNFQKLLADGLRFAPRLQRADLQRTNLQNAYLGDKGEQAIDLSGADFFRADLSEASLKGARAQGAVFYQARLANTVLTGADLRDANFFEAELKGARFAKCQLEGAMFKGARNIPADVAEHLDDQGRWVEKPSSESGAVAAAATPVRIFLSRPAVMRASTEGEVEALQQQILRLGPIELVKIERNEYPSFGSLGEVRRKISGCAGIVVVGVGELQITQGTWRPATQDERSLQGDAWPSPWCQIEAGIAIGLDLPVLLFAPPEMNMGVFAHDADGHLIFRVEGLAAISSGRARAAFDDWIAAARKRAAGQAQ